MLDTALITSAMQNVFSYNYHMDNIATNELVFGDIDSFRSSRQAARAWANAYRVFADTGTAFFVSPNSLDLSEAVLYDHLIDIFVLPAMPTLVTNLTAAFTAFWLGDPIHVPPVPPVSFPSVPPGVVTAVLGAPAFASALDARWGGWAGESRSNSVEATFLATALDAMTRTVEVTQPGPNIDFVK